MSGSFARLQSASLPLRLFYKLRLDKFIILNRQKSYEVETESGGGREQFESLSLSV